MKRNNLIPLICILTLALGACEKDIDETRMTAGVPSTMQLTPATVTLSKATANDTVATIAWSAADFGYPAAVNYRVELAKGGTNFASPQSVNMGTTRQLKYLGSALNDLAIGLGIAPETTGTIDFRVKSSLSDSLFILSAPGTLTVTTFQVDYPALLVRGGNSWVTPEIRSAGYLLTSPNFDSKYEGYLYLPNSDNYGGDAFKLESTSTGTVYGWGGTETTLGAGASGNLWLTPAPNYMKVNADVSALTINFKPVHFNIPGDHNGWNVTGTPMTYDPVTKQLVATNVSLTADKGFVFIANGSYDLSYKVDATGKLIFAGPPDWKGTNIPTPGTGVYTIRLDLSGGNGLYTFSVE